MLTLESSRYLYDNIPSVVNDIPFLQERKIAISEASRFGIKYYNALSLSADFLLFPFYSLTGVLESVGFRKLGTHDFFQPHGVKPSVGMFGLPQALPLVFKESTVVLVEGVTDFLSISRYTPLVLATMSCNVSNRHLTFLSRFVKNIVCLFDMDEPGRNGAEYLQKSLKDIMVVIPEFPFKDINKFLCEEPVLFSTFLQKKVFPFIGGFENAG